MADNNYTPIPYDKFQGDVMQAINKKHRKKVKKRKAKTPNDRGFGSNTSVGKRR